MRKVMVIAVCLFLAGNIPAQHRKSYVVRAGEIPIEVLPNEALYSFPTFKRGTVFLRDGTSSWQNLNYNIVLDEMHFIGPGNDTLAIADPELTKYIIIDTVTYYFDKNYFQVIAKMDSFKIAVKQFLVQSPYRTLGGYDAHSSASSITTYGNIYSGGRVSRLQVKKDVELEKKSAYFVSDRFNHFLKADKKAFLKIFSNRRALIEKYLRENQVNFNDETQLKSLLAFCVLQH